MKPSHDEIARRAHAIWEHEGRPEGRAAEHWAEAEAAFADREAAPAVAPGGDRVEGEEAGETEARMPDGSGAGRPGQGPYAGP